MGCQYSGLPHAHNSANLCKDRRIVFARRSRRGPDCRTFSCSGWKCHLNSLPFHTREQTPARALAHLRLYRSKWLDTNVLKMEWNNRGKKKSNSKAKSEQVKRRGYPLSIKWPGVMIPYIPGMCSQPVTSIFKSFILSGVVFQEKIKPSFYCLKSHCNIQSKDYKTCFGNVYSVAIIQFIEMVILFP